MRATGETLDATNSDASVLSHFLQRWHRRQGTAYEALDLAARETSTDIRVQRDGTFLFASSSFPTLEMDHIVIDEWPHTGRKLVAPDRAPLVYPGVTFEGDRIDFVTTEITAGQIRQELWLQDAA